MFSKDNERLNALRELEMDRSPNQSFDDITRLAANICDAPISLITLIDEDVWTKSRYGLSMLSTVRDDNICAYAIQNPSELMVVENTLEDDRFKHNPSVMQNPKLRFYAGISLITKTNYPIGTICVMDDEPRTLDLEQRTALFALSRITMKVIYAHSFYKRIKRNRVLLDQKTLELLESIV